jgi:hypothetical protein
MSDLSRSPKTFGVAGLLKENCTIYYANDFKSRSMGRLADLMSAKLREVNADELKFRAVLLYGLYEAYAALGKGFSSTTDLPTVQLEVGVDDDHVAVGVSFHADFSFVNTDGLEMRINQNQAANPFEELLVFVHSHSSRVVLKHQKNKNRVEIVTLLNFDPLARAKDFSVFDVEDNGDTFLEVQGYIEMGDLNYIDLTREALPSDTPESLAASEPVLDPELEAILKSAEEEQTPPDESTDTVIVSQSKAGKTSESEVQVVGGTSDSRTQRDQSPIKVSGKTLEKSSESFEKRFTQEQAKPESSVQVVEGVAEFHKENGEQIWPFQEGAAVSTPEVLEEPVALPSHLNPEETLQKIQQIATATSETIERQAIPDTGGQSPDEKRFRNWADGLVKEITKERAQLHELTKNASKQVRQREIEFKNQERAMKTDLRLKDEQIRQKDSLLEKKLEQIAQLTMSYEKLKSSGSAGNETSLKSKLTMTQKLLDMKTEEIKATSKKMNDLENRLMVAQAKSSKTTQDPELISKLSATERKLDEYKRLNQRLMESLNNPKEKSDNQEAQDLRRKLELLDRQYNESKKSLEKQAFKLREIQESERKTQADMQRVIDENRKLRQQSNKNEAA